MNQTQHCCLKNITNLLINFPVSSSMNLATGEINTRNWVNLFLQNSFHSPFPKSKKGISHANEASLSTEENFSIDFFLL